MEENIGRPGQDIMSRHDKEPSAHPASEIRLLVVLLVFICAVVTVVHWPALSAEAILFDDAEYLLENQLVQNPSWASARRFLTEVLEPSTVGGYYQPLAMISLMFDCALGGQSDNFRPFHRTSLALHVANTALVIVLLYSLFGRVWVVAAVGLLFGVHPLTVEPITWVGERKTLLAMFFALWSLILYVRFTRKYHWKFYVGCLMMYLLALMSKPTSLPLPAVMLLIDFWPLGRLKRGAVLEKVPFFAVVAVFAAITYVSQSRTLSVVPPPGHGPWRIPLLLCHNIIFYLYKVVWPVNLSSYYAHPEPLGLSHPMVLAGVVGTCTLLALLVISLRWTRAALTCWSFFFVAIFPTMGVIGFTKVVAADKFAYLPSIGLLMALVALLGWFWGTGNADKFTTRGVLVVVVALILAGAEAGAVRHYLAYWRDTVSFYEHVLKLAPKAAPVHNHFGVALASQGEFDEAINHYRQALHIDPNFAKAYNNLGIALQRKGELAQAITYYRQALRIRPADVGAQNNLAVALALEGELDEAISHFRQAIEAKPDYELHFNLGIALQLQGNVDEAIEQYRRALQINPSYTKARDVLKLALAKQRQNRQQ